MFKVYNICPVSKPRQTRADKWKQRPCVMRYRAFADEVRANGIDFQSCDTVIFVIPMPKSWSKKKKKEMEGKEHKQKPDIDNLQKALLDSIHKDDSHIWGISAFKIWGTEGRIILEHDDAEKVRLSELTRRLYFKTKI